MSGEVIALASWLKSSTCSKHSDASFEITTHSTVLLCTQFLEQEGLCLRIILYQL